MESKERTEDAWVFPTDDRKQQNERSKGGEICKRICGSLWKSWFECIFKYHLGENRIVLKDLNNAQPTAFTVFPNYGLQFLTNESFYYFSSSKKKLTKNDIVLHTLLVDPGNVTNVTYAILFILKTYKKSEMRQLEVDSFKYQLQEQVDLIIAYIRSSGKVRTAYLPKWDELNDLAREYRIEVQ